LIAKMFRLWLLSTPNRIRVEKRKEARVDSNLGIISSRMRAFDRGQ